MFRTRRIAVSAVLAAIVATVVGLVVVTPALAHPELAGPTTSHAQLVRSQFVTSPIVRATTFTPRLTGDQEVDAVGSARGSVSVAVRLSPANGTVRFRKLVPALLFEREDEFGPTKFHIHRGVKGQNGPVVIDLTDVANQGQTRGRVKADPALVAEIAAHPENFYLNYHTISHPDGAVRAQLG